MCHFLYVHFSLFINYSLICQTTSTQWSDVICLQCLITCILYWSLHLDDFSRTISPSPTPWRGSLGSQCHAGCVPQLWQWTDGHHGKTGGSEYLSQHGQPVCCWCFPSDLAAPLSLVEGAYPGSTRPELSWVPCFFASLLPHRCSPRLLSLLLAAVQNREASALPSLVSPGTAPFTHCTQKCMF